MFMIFKEDTYGASSLMGDVFDVEFYEKIFKKGTIVLRMRQGDHDNNKTDFILHDGKIFEVHEMWLEEVVPACEDSSKEC